MTTKKLLFLIDEIDNTLQLHIDESVIIPFENLEEWKKFANDMLHMIPEITKNIE